MDKVVTLEQFTGPLDLLLELIEQEKLPITEISLSKVTEQYLEYLNTLAETQPEELADFLVIASKLLYLKSKTLLPHLVLEEDEGPSLAKQLALYKCYIEASKKVVNLWLEPRAAYGRLEPPLKMEHFIFPSNVVVSNLHQSFFSLLKRLKPIDPIPKLSIDRSVSVKQKVAFLFQSLQKLKQLNFSYVVATAENRTEIVVSFLALLELIKEQRVSINQEAAFDELVIRIV